MEQEFLNSLYFKSILITYEKDELIKMLDQSDDPLETFIVLLSDTAQVDPSFFALDDSFLDKISFVIHKYRFDGTNRDEETINKINEVIRFCNGVKAFSDDDKDKIYSHYVGIQTVQRHKLIYYEEDLYEAISMDAVVYESVKNNQNMDNPYIRDNIISTTNYILQNYFPLVIDRDYFYNLKNILEDEKYLSKKDRKNGKRLLKTMKSMESII